VYTDVNYVVHRYACICITQIKKGNRTRVKTAKELI
jgi:hypothetical protein